MKLQLLLILGLVAASAAYKKAMLESNRVVKAFTGSCDECQTIIHKIVAAADDPAALAELKTLLNILCHETVYVDECRVFVSKIDIFVKKLKPYLVDAEKVCAKIHLCSNAKIDTFRRLLSDYSRRLDSVSEAQAVPQIVCDECEFAIKEMKKAVEDKQLQTDVRDFLRNNICHTMGSYRGFCDLVVDEYLPQFIQEVDVVLQDPHQVCVDLKACPAVGKIQARKYVGLLGWIQKL